MVICAALVHCISTFLAQAVEFELIGVGAD